MKVLYIHTYYKQRGGEDTVYENEKKLMADGGWEVDSVLFNNTNYTVLKFLLLFFNPFSFMKVCRAINRFKPDVVHIHNWFFGASPSVFLAARMRNVPILHTLHNFRMICPSGVLFNGHKLYTKGIASIFPFSAIKKKVYKNSSILTFWLLSCTRLNYLLGTWMSIDRFICLTNTSKNIFANSFLKVPKRKITVKPNFVRSITYPVAEHRSNTFLYVGRLANEKGIEILLEAFARSNHLLKIIGDGPLKQDVEIFCSIHKNVTCDGFRNKEEIIKEMRRCSAVIVPSICYEQFGLVIIEALSCSTPVIASNIGAPADLVCDGKNGMLFIAGSSSDLIDKLKKWNSQTRESKCCFYQNALLSYTNNFTSQINFAQITSIYKSVISEKNKYF